MGYDVSIKDEHSDVNSDAKIYKTAHNLNVFIPTEPTVHSKDGDKKEQWYIILLQVLFPFLIAGFGMVGAGAVLDIVQVIK